VGPGLLGDAERRLTLLSIDRCWSEYLEEMQAVRDEIHLVALGGRTPLAEFNRGAIASFEPLLKRIDDTIVSGFESLRITADGVDWKGSGLRGPSATWTYLVNDNVFAGNLLMNLANRPSIALWGTLTLWPVLLAWGVYLHWRKRRGKSAGTVKLRASRRRTLTGS
jgi:preprotein translocase subunit SecA